MYVIKSKRQCSVVIGKSGIRFTPGEEKQFERIPVELKHAIDQGIVEVVHADNGKDYETLEDVAFFEGYDKLNAPDAIDYIEKLTDLDFLEKLFAIEKRKLVQDALQRKIRDLTDKQNRLAEIKKVIKDKNVKQSEKPEQGEKL